MPNPKVLFVCLGNICRSPMAHGLLRQLAKEHDIALEVDSCGTSSHHAGEAPDLRAQAKMQEKGIDISDLKSRPFKASDFEEFDQIYVMDRSNMNNVLYLARSEEHKAKVKLFLTLGEASQEEVPDPYYGSKDGFELVYQLLQVASKEWVIQHQ